MKTTFHAGVVLVFTTGIGWCAPITWTLSNATFNDGGVATGYFVFDAATRTISDWNIVTTAGSTLPAFTYTPATSVIAYPSNGCSSPPCIFFASKATFPNGLPPPYNFNEDRDLELLFAVPLADSGGIVGINLNASAECLDCDPYRLFTQGSVRAGAASLSTAPSITSGGVVPLYSTVNTIQSGEWVSIYGANLASSTVTWNGNFPASLGDTSVTINGKSAYLSYVSPTQINLQAPNDTTTGSVPVVVTTAVGTATSTVTLAPFAPSFLLLDGKHVAGIIPRSNGSGAYGGGTYDILGPTGNSLGYATSAAKAGDTIALFATGLGLTSPTVPAGQAFSGAAPTTNTVRILLNNVSVTPTFAGLSGAGLYQINLTVPTGLGTGDVSLVANVGGVQTPLGVVISLGAPPQIQNLTLSSNSVASGATVTGRVAITTSAPSTGLVVTLSSSSGIASIPASVTVPAGATSATFTVSAGTVSSNQTVTITASLGGTSAQATLTVGPQVNPQCTNVSGSWDASESGSMTLSLLATTETDTLTNPVNGKGVVTIAQNGCSIQYDPIAISGLIGTNLTPSQVASLRRSGIVSGNSVSITGLTALIDTVAATVLGLTITNVSSNLMTANGQVAGNVLTLNATGTFAASGTYSISGQSGSFTLTITTSSTATLNWASGVRPASATSTEMWVVPDRASSPQVQELVGAALKKVLIIASH